MVHSGVLLDTRCRYFGSMNIYSKLSSRWTRYVGHRSWGEDGYLEVVAGLQGFGVLILERERVSFCCSSYLAGTCQRMGSLIARFSCPIFGFPHSTLLSSSPVTFRSFMWEVLAWRNHGSRRKNVGARYAKPKIMDVRATLNSCAKISLPFSNKKHDHGDISNASPVVLKP